VPQELDPLLDTDVAHHITAMSDRKTCSEALFERFLGEHGLPFNRIDTSASRRPDYVVGEGEPWGPIVFEVKELTTDDNFKNDRGSRKPGKYIRQKINESREQIQYGARQGMPSILLIYNALDSSFHLFGTEDHDFRIAMHGDLTLDFGVESRMITAAYYGRNRSLSEARNTSFTALGHLAPMRGVMTVRLFPNDHAKVPLPVCLPSCFEIVPDAG
jgi:hypothetical protein